MVRHYLSKNNLNFAECVEYDNNERYIETRFVNITCTGEAGCLLWSLNID